MLLGDIRSGTPAGPHIQPQGRKPSERHRKEEGERPLKSGLPSTAFFQAASSWGPGAGQGAGTVRSSASGPRPPGQPLALLCVISDALGEVT